VATGTARPAVFDFPGRLDLMQRARKKQKKRIQSLDDKGFGAFIFCPSIILINIKVN
jgi:hypothetical protein